MILEISMLSLTLLAIATLLASTFQGATGYGYGLMAVPFYLIILGSKDAIQIGIMVMLVISLSLLPSIYREVNKPLLIRLVGGSLIGFIIGTVLYIKSDVVILKLLVGLSILGAVSILLLSTKSSNSFSPGPTKEVVTGTFSGTLASSIALPGPPVLIYMTVHGHTKDHIRTTNLALMTFSNVGAIIAQTVFVGISFESVKISGILGIIAIFGALSGARLTRFLDEDTFRKASIAVLLLTGLYMIFGPLIYR